jgi:tetratricopeptide (TPR) repeat protein
LETARLREETLHTQIGTTSRELDVLYEQSRADLASALEELGRLTEDQERSVLIEWQISGYYNKVNDQIRLGQLEEASKTLETMREYLNTPAFQNIRIIQTRKELNAASINALQVMIDETLRRRKESMAISQILKNQPVTDELRKLSENAENAYAEGDTRRAEILYREALNFLPALGRLQTNFVTGPLEEESRRIETGNSSLAQGEALFQVGNYQGFLDSYSAAMAFLPYFNAREKEIKAHLQRAGYETTVLELRRREAEGADSFIRQGEAYFSAAQYGEAETAYLSVIERFPHSVSQISAAVAGLRKTMEARNAPSTNSSETNTIASLRSQIESLNRTIAELQGRGGAAPVQTPAEPVIDDRYPRLVNLYNEYVRREDAAMARAGNSAASIVETKIILNDFLSSAEVNTAFPGINDRVKKYDEAFSAAAHNEALLFAGDYAARLSTYRNRADMEQFLTTEINRHSDDPRMKEYLDSLRVFVK